MIENIEQARIAFAEILEFVYPSEIKIREYIQSNKELVILFEVKSNLPKLAMRARLRIQAAEEYLNNK